VSATEGVLTGLLIVATALWLGGLFTIAIVARVATHTLEPAQRVAFFRVLGRCYGVVGTAALALAYVTGAALAHNLPWDAMKIAVAAVAATLAAALAVGVMQARRMTLLRRRALSRADDAVLAARVRRGALRADVLRGLIGALSLTLLVLGVALAS
jgi:hypothetical protein